MDIVKFDYTAENNNGPLIYPDEKQFFKKSKIIAGSNNPRKVVAEYTGPGYEGQVAGNQSDFDDATQYKTDMTLSDFIKLFTDEEWTGWQDAPNIKLRKILAIIDHRVTINVKSTDIIGDLDELETQGIVTSDRRDIILKGVEL